MRGDWKVRGGQLIPDKGAEWIGICHHEQDVSLPSKWGVFSFSLKRGFVPEKLIMCCVNINIEFLCAG